MFDPDSSSKTPATGEPKTLADRVQKPSAAQRVAPSSGISTAELPIASPALSSVLGLLRPSLDLLHRATALQPLPFPQQDLGQFLEQLEISPQQKSRLADFISSLSSPQSQLAHATSSRAELAKNLSKLDYLLDEKLDSSDLSTKQNNALSEVQRALSKLSAESASSESNKAEGVNGNSNQETVAARFSLQALLALALPSLEDNASGTGGDSLQKLVAWQLQSLSSHEPKLRQILATTSSEQTTGGELELLLGTIKSVQQYLFSATEKPPISGTLPELLRSSLTEISENLKLLVSKPLEDSQVVSSLRQALSTVENYLQFNDVPSIATNSPAFAGRSLPESAKDLLQSISQLVERALKGETSSSLTVDQYLKLLSGQIEQFNLNSFDLGLTDKGELRGFVESLSRDLTALAKLGSEPQQLSQLLTARAGDLEKLAEKYQQAIAGDPQFAAAIDQLRQRIGQTISALASDGTSSQVGDSLGRLLDTLRGIGVEAFANTDQPEQKLAQLLRSQLTLLPARESQILTALDPSEAETGATLLLSSVKAIEIAIAKLPRPAGDSSPAASRFAAVNRHLQDLGRGLQQQLGQSGSPVNNQELQVLLLQQQGKLQQLIADFSQSDTRQVDLGKSMQQPDALVQRLLRSLSLQQSAVLEGMGQEPKSLTLSTATSADSHRFAVSRLLEDLSRLEGGLEQRISAEQKFSSFISGVREQISALATGVLPPDSGLDGKPLAVLGQILNTIREEFGSEKQAGSGQGAELLESALPRSYRTALRALETQISSLLVAAEPNRSVNHSTAQVVLNQINATLEQLTSPETLAKTAQQKDFLTAIRQLSVDLRQLLSGPDKPDELLLRLQQAAGKFGADNYSAGRGLSESSDPVGPESSEPPRSSETNSRSEVVESTRRILTRLNEIDSRLRAQTARPLGEETTAIDSSKNLSNEAVITKADSAEVALRRLSETLTAFEGYRQKSEARELADATRLIERQIQQLALEQRNTSRNQEVENTASQLSDALKDLQRELQRLSTDESIVDLRQLLVRGLEQLQSAALGQKAADAIPRPVSDALQKLIENVKAFLDKYSQEYRPLLTSAGGLGMALANQLSSTLSGQSAGGAGQSRLERSSASGVHLASVLEQISVLRPPVEGAPRADHLFYQFSRDLLQSLTSGGSSRVIGAELEGDLFKGAIEKLQSFITPDLPAVVASTRQAVPSGYNQLLASGGMLSANYSAAIPQLSEQLRMLSLYQQGILSGMLAQGVGQLGNASVSSGVSSGGLSTNPGQATLESLLGELSRVSGANRVDVLREIFQSLLRIDSTDSKQGSGGSQKFQAVVKELLAELEANTKGESARGGGAEQNDFISQAVAKLNKQLSAVGTEQDSAKFKSFSQAVKGLEQIVRGQEALSQINPLLQMMGEPTFILFPQIVQGMLQKIEVTFYPHFVQGDGQRQKNPEKKRKRKGEGDGDGLEGGEHGGTTGEQQKQYRRVQIQFSLPQLGPLEVDFVHSLKEALLSIRCEQPQAAEFVSEKIIHLEPILRSLGFEQIESSVSQGKVNSVRPEWVEATASGRIA